jgi:hypothetical protein
MPTEELKFLITAEDRATRRIRAATDDIERQAKHVKEVGGNAKASTEMVGSLATAMGGADVGGFAGEIAMLTERISAFSEVAKGGGAAALAMKGGIAAAVAVISFKVGNAIGNAVFQTGRWNEELEKAKQNMADLGSRQIAALSRSFTQQMDQIDLLETQAQKQAKLEELQARINNELQGAIRNLKEIDEDETEQIANGKARVDQLRQQKQLLEDQTSERAKQLRIARSRVAGAETIRKLENEIGDMLARDGGKQRQMIREAFESGGDAGQIRDILSLLQKRNEIQKRQEAEKEAARQREKQHAEAMKQAEEDRRTLQKKRIDELKDRIENRKDQIKQIGEAIREREKLADKLKNASTGTNAQEQRLISGRGQQAENQLLTIQKTHTTKLEKQIQVLENMQAELERLNEKDGLTITTIGD